MAQIIVFQTGPIQVPALALNSRETGAVVEFLGIVREMEGEQVLKGIHYEGYEKMARFQLERIFQELGARSEVFAVSFIHRLGWVPVGEASLFVRVQTAHRGEAFVFLSELITRMKKDVPIWKRL